VPGVPGKSGGHNRKRTDQRLGNANHAKDSYDHHDNVDKPMTAGPVVQPELTFPTGEIPHPEIVELWESMAVSGFHEYYTMADWHAAKLQLLHINRMITEMSSNPSISLPANKMAEMRSIFADLMITESARRRLKIEVQRHKDTPAPLASVAPLDRAKASGL